MHYVLVNLREPNSLHNLALLNMARGRHLNVILLDPVEKKGAILNSPEFPAAVEVLKIFANSTLFYNCLRVISEAGNDSSIRASFTTQHPLYNNNNPGSTFFYVNMANKKVTTSLFSTYGALTSDDVVNLVTAQVLDQLNNNPSRAPELVKGILAYQDLLTAKKLDLGSIPVPSPYNEHYYYNFSITNYTGFTPDYTPSLSGLKSLLSADDFIKYLTWSFPEESFSTPRGVTAPLPPTMVFKPASSSYWVTALHHPFSVFSDGFFYSGDDDTNAFALVKDNTASSPFIFLVKEFPENLPRFVDALLHHYWNNFREIYAIREDTPLGNGFNFKRSTLTTDDVSALANSEAFKLFGKSFGIMASTRWRQVPGHIVSTITRQPKSLEAQNVLSSFNLAMKRRDNTIQQIATYTTDLVSRQRELERISKIIEEQNLRIKTLQSQIEDGQKTLEQSTIDFDSVNTSIENMLSVYAEHSFDLTASFNGLVGVLNKFNAYIHKIVFTEGTMTFDLKTKSYKYERLSDPSDTEYTFAEVFTLASNQFPRAIEICITKPFVNSHVGPNGELSKICSYILQPMYFRYDLLTGAGVLAGGNKLSFSRSADNIKKVHPHLPSVNVTDGDLTAYQYFSHHWQGSYPQGARVYEFGGEPCVGSLSSHVGAARDSKDFAHFVRACLAWCTSNAGLNDAWSSQCTSFDDKLTLEQVLLPLKDPMRNLKLDSVYFNDDSQEFYALLRDTAIQQRIEWAAQAAELNPIPSFLPYHLYKIPSTKNSDTSFVLDFSNIQPTNHLSSTATNRIRRLAKARRLPFEAQLTKMKSRVTIEVIKAPAPVVGESESVDVSPA